jgi:glycolate oxidase FAD binding subunit
MKAVAQVLESIVGVASVCAWDTLTKTQRSPILQATMPGSPLSHLVYPNTPEELAAVMSYAEQQGLRMLPCGRGSKLHWGGLVEGVNLVISTERINRLVDHAIGDLTVTAESGIKFSDLQELLRKSGQFLAIDPHYPDQATLGGIISTADTGALRHRYSSIRDMILGISFVRSDGQLVKAGGRVVKNVAGYDLMKLLTGAYGTLGIITQVTLRVYPISHASQTVVLSGHRDQLAQAAQTLLSSALTPTAIEALSAQTMSDLELGEEMGLLIRFQAITESVREQAARSLEVGAAFGLSSRLYPETNETDLWRRLGEKMVGETDSIVCKIGVKPSEAIAVLTQIEQLSQTAGTVIHLGSGVGQLVLSSETRTFIIQELRSLCQATGGYLSVLQAPISFKQQIDVWGYAGNALDLMQKIKTQFDPNSLLSPRRFVSGI